MIPIKRFLLLALFLTCLIQHSNAQQTMNTMQTLDNRQQSIVSISALTAVGDLDGLKGQLNSGLDAGLTVNEIKEILVHLYAYCGFPISLNGINTFMAVLDERKAKGIVDIQGKETAATKSTDKYERGRKVLEELTKTPQTKPAPGFGAFAPRIDAFLKEHLFGDVFESDVLTYQQRELVTISALASMSGVQAQLRSHLKVGMNTGITENQLAEVADIVEKNISRTQANSLRNSLSKSSVSIIQPDMMIRISEIEIAPQYLDDYKSILKEESAASVRIEPGVIAIFPMYQSQIPTQIRIVEIYRDSAAYQSHLKTPHFQHYKTSTTKMVKSLKLVDMIAIDSESMIEIFSKLK